MSFEDRRDARHGVALRHSWWTLLATATILAVLLSTFSFIPGKPIQPAEAAAGSGLFAAGSTKGATFTNGSSSGGNYLVSWASMEPRPNKHDWSGLEKALARAEAAGKTIVLRVYTNWSMFGQGTPDWFFNIIGAESYYPNNSARARGYESPIPWDDIFQDRFADFIRELGSRYDGHEAIEFIQVTGVGVYGEFWLGENAPGGYTHRLHLDSARYWTDVWRDAFPNTNLAMMVNGIGHNIGEMAAADAVSRGFYLQSNNHANTEATRAILGAHDHETRIVIEAENGGCTTATMATGFRQQMEETFKFGYEIDYLMLCYASFTDPQTVAYLPNVKNRLRSTSSANASATPASATATPTTTSAPVSSGIQSDDFSSSSLDTSLWSVVDPVGGATVSTRVAANGNARLRIDVPGGASHNPYHVNRSVRVMQPAGNSDFQIEAKFDSPVTQTYQIQGLLVQQDTDDWLRVDINSDAGNMKLYAGSTANGTTATRAHVVISSGTPLWLRITRQGNQWTNSYSYNGTNWRTLVTYTRTMTVQSVGVFGANHGAPDSSPAHTTLVDYFFNTASPISPEDGGSTSSTASTESTVLAAEPTSTPSPATATPAPTETPSTPTTGSSWGARR